MIDIFHTKYYKKAVIFLFLFALTIRIFVAFINNKNEVWTSFADDLGREKYANTILNKGYIFDITNFKSAESIFAPGIPSIIALNKLVFENSWLPIFILNALLGAISCIIIFFIGLHFFNKQVSLLVLFWVAFYPNYIRYIGSAGNEPWLIFLFALSFLLLIKIIESPKLNLLIVLFALCFTLLFHFDERYITYSPLFTIFLFLGRHTSRVKFKRAIVFILLSITFSSPWIIRNYIVYNDVVLISCRTTSITNPVFNHRKELLFFDHVPKSRYLSSQQIDSVQKGLLTKFSSGTAISQGQIEAMKSGNIPHLFTSFEKIVSRIHFLWMPLKLKDHYRIDGYNFKKAWSLQHNLLTGLSFGLVLLFAILGIILLFLLKRWKVLIIFLSILMYHTFIHVAFIPYTRDRYRHPVDFIVIILGCYGICICFNLFKSGSIIRRKMKLNLQS